MEMSVITDRDGSKYFYTTASYTAANPLGVAKATLVEYASYQADNTQVPVAKLYKTNEGNWYDAPADVTINTQLATSLKMAIDEIERMQTHSKSEL